MRHRLSNLAIGISLCLAALPAQAVEWGQYYASARNWDVYQSDSGCMASRPTGEMIDMTMLISPMGNFELLFSTSKPNDSLASVMVSIDGRSTHDEYIAVDGWLHGVFETPLREEMAAGVQVEVMIDGAITMLPLDGVTAALLKLEECWYDLAQPDPNTSRALPVALPSQAGGVAPGRAPTRDTAGSVAPGRAPARNTPQAPAPAENMPMRTSEFYGETRGWTVQKEYDGGSYMGCTMRRGPGFDMSLALYEGQWFLSFPFMAANGTQVMMDMDMDRASNVMPMDVYDNIASGAVDPGWVEGIASARNYFVNLPGGSREISMSGTAAAILKVKECAGVVATPAPAAQVIENDAYRPGLNCPVIGSVKSPNVQDWGDVTFINLFDAAITLYWLDANGAPQEKAGLLPGERIKFVSNAGHYWLARDFQGTCHGGTIEVGFGDTFYEIR
jgi:hypothetical protein